jgi:hypothetical protein
VKLLLLHSLGEIGKSFDLSAFALEAVIIQVREYRERNDSRISTLNVE